MNVYLSIGCEYKYDLAKWLVKREDVDEVYMDYYVLHDTGKKLESRHCHYVNMERYRRHDAADKVNISKYPMPDTGLLRKALKYESMAVHMGMRETNYPIHTYEESKRSYLFFFRLWSYWLDKMDPGYIFFEEIPHCMSIYVMYVVARVKKIPLTVINPTGIRLNNYSGGVYVYGHTIKNLGSNIGELYARIKDQPADKFTISGKVKTYFDRSLKGKNEAANSEESRKEWADFVYKQEFSPYMKRFYNLKYYAGFLAKKAGYKGRTGQFGKLKIEDFMRVRECRRRVVSYVGHHTISLKEYDRKAVLPDYSKKYVYFPLQQMPEATLFPLAGVYGEQYNAIQMLSRITEPYGVYVYIKEYFIQPYRDKNFWEDIRQLKNVKLIKSSVASIDMIKGCIATANQTGTCLMESVFEGKPALAFGGGHNWKGMPGLFEVQSERQGRKVIGDILSGYKIDMDDLRKYFYCIQQNSIEYYINVDYTVDRGREFDNTMAYLKELIGSDLNRINGKGGTNGP